MVDGFLLPALSLATLILVIGFALWSKRATENKMDDPQAKKSTLAKDGPGPQPFR